MGESIIASIAMYFNFLSVIFLTVFSGVGYSYFSQDYFFTNCSINHKIMFGCGIGCGLILFILNILLYASPTFPFHYVFTIPSFIVVVCLYITYTTSKEKNVCLSHHKEKWYTNEYGFKDFQVQYRCCGWENSTDHGLPICPYEFKGSCSKVFNDYITPRLKMVFISAILILSLLVVTYIILYITLFVEYEDDFCSLFILF